VPPSLKFVLALLVFAVLLAFGAGFVEIRQDENRARLTAAAITHGNPEDGERAIRRFGCGACHAIGGIGDARGKVGPSLSEVAERAELAGQLANTPDNMVRWIRDPQGVKPGVGMPNLAIGERDGRNIAAYLYTLRKVPRNP
jgi:cytochrome c2